MANYSGGTNLYAGLVRKSGMAENFPLANAEDIQYKSTGSKIGQFESVKSKLDSLETASSTDTINKLIDSKISGVAYILDE